MTQGWWRAAWARLFVSRAQQAALDRELQAHLDLEAEDYLDAGLTPDEARRAAFMALGNPTRIKEDAREVGRAVSFDHLVRDVSHAVRMLRRDARFTAAVVLTLSLGVGANAAMFGLVDALLFRPPDHVRAPDRLVDVNGVTNYVQYADLSDRVRTVDLTSYIKPVTLSFGVGPDAAPARTQCVTHTYFPVVGAEPLVGRTFSAADDRPGAEPTIVIGYNLWQRQFGADRAIIGRSVTLAGKSVSVIGVAPAGFAGVATETIDVWTPLAASPLLCSFTGANLLWSTKAHWLTTIARLHDGVDLSQAETEMASLRSVIDADQTDGSPKGSPTSHRPLLELLYASRRSHLSGTSQVALWLAGGALLVLLIACANVAGLLSARAIDRRREIAVRLQLGATRSRLLAQLLVENLLLAALCGVVALGVTVLLARALQEYFPLVVNASLFGARALGVLAGYAVLAGMLSGLVPAMQLSRQTHAGPSRGSRAVVAEHSRFRNGLIVAQIALALVLVVVTGLFVRSLDTVMKDVGYDLDHVVVATIDFQRAGYRRSADVAALFDAMLSRVRQVPQVETVALSSGAVLGFGGGVSFATAVRSSITAPPQPGGFPVMTVVSADYFKALGFHLRRGRPFAAQDDGASPPVIILDEAMAADLWPGEDAVGKCTFLMGRDACVRVIGISESRRDADGSARNVFYVPLGQHNGLEATVAPRTLIIRVRSTAHAALAAITSAVRGAAPNLPFVNVRPLGELADVQARAWRLGTRMFGLFGSAAVLLAAIGLYGVLAFSTKQRTPEIGLRMALGAMPREILGMVVRQGVALVSIGWLVGTASAFALTGLLRKLLFNVAPTDAAAFLLASVVIALAGLAGCLVPAIRASRIDPSVALKCE